ncbi:MAG: 16S rRNA (guanine(966)-N(2))-methyltransferase RsmD [Verrucomicrobia bacterium]|jgi:16S rRNA (guanine966-N2)-methyltransferase|nr:16S rRNA (guanine(966)-N(2))-methyltransferase RsmD [Verrucomicrobiota bacterium]MBT7066812.1 16S rRNA (guanine(966)-N(2))-methyltransferase RsmD [Verrucomicrobiota bacterium]MBT7702240.1 16S rRNA (guanine(966)-N(2))-methyltransferase RsmD [Verrucomicrobiota bacterium]
MRITGGEFRGRVLRAPKSGVRPTQDMVRQAVFNILMGRIDGSRFLDLYAGSGAVGLEALSRGAVGVTWVERERKSLTVLRRNVAEIGGSSSAEASSFAKATEDESEGRRNAGRVVSDEAVRFLRRRAGREAYDVIYADPPYVDSRAGDNDPLAELLEAIGEGDVLARDGVFVYESAGGRRAQAVELPEGWGELMDREYGRTRVRVFERG